MKESLKPSTKKRKDDDLIGLILVIARLSYSDLVAGAVACPVCDAQKPGGGSLPCIIAKTKPNRKILKHVCVKYK